MKPAASLILFTVLSGIGLGAVALAVLGLGGPAASVLGILLAAAGGAASSAHLARPDRAWRAFSQWRSSWLSREACLMVATLGLAALDVALTWATGLRLWPLDIAVAALAAATVYCTAMIYAQLRTVPRWSVAPTPALFLALSGAGGLLATGAVSALAGGAARPGLALAGLVLAAGVAVWWQTSAAGAGRSALGTTAATATGLGRMGRIRAFEPPHTGANYLLEEMAFSVGRRRAFALRRLGAVLGFLVPAALVALAWPLGGWTLLPALVSHAAGVMALRWLFFAEAEHVQAFYYGTAARAA